MKAPKIYAEKLAYSLVSMVIIIYGLWLLQGLIIPLIFSCLLALLLLPINHWLELRGFPRLLAILISIVLVVLFVSLASIWLYTQFSEFEEILPQLSTKAEKTFNEFQNFIRREFNVGKRKQISEGQKYLTEFIKNSGSILSSSINTVLSFLSNLALVPLYVFLMLLYRTRFRVFLYKIFGKNHKVRVDTILTNIKKVVLSYVSGLLLVIVIVGLLNAIGLYIIGIDFAFFFGFLAAVLIIFPYVGIVIGAVLPILFALVTKDSYTPAVLTAILFGGVQFLEGNFITPYIVGSKVSVNALVAIVSLLLFGTLWGLSGLILALPLTAILKVIFDSVDILKPYGYLIGDTD